MSLTPAKASVLAAATALIFLGLFISAAHAQVLFPARGGTGTSTVPTLGQILMGQANGSWGPQATSTLGLLTTNVAEGSNLYYTDGRVASYLVGSTTLPALLNYWTKNGSNLHYAGGNVGIGTAAPAHTLQVAADGARGSGGAGGQIVASGATNINQRLNLGYDTTSDYGYVEAAIVGSSWRNLVLQGSGGNVGIGTSAPATELHVAGTGSTLLTVSGGATNSPGFLINQSTTNKAFIRYADGGASTDRLEVQSDGHIHLNPVSNVGIATSAPTEKLSVAGNALLTGTFPYLSLTPSGWGSTTYIQAGVNQESNASGDYLTTIVPSGKGFAFTQGTLPLVVIDTTGNMGVGTGTGSINGKLDVAGIINVSGVEGSNGLRWSAGDAEIAEASYNLIFKTWTGSDLTEKMRVTGEGNIGIGTSSPSSLLQLFSTATTTFSVDSNSATQGSCLELKDSDGSGYSYITVADGAMTVSTTSCK